jgi:hypothetical protein
MTRQRQLNCWNPRVLPWTNLKKNGASPQSFSTYNFSTCHC